MLSDAREVKGQGERMAEAGGPLRFADGIPAGGPTPALYRVVDGA